VSWTRFARTVESVIVSTCGLRFWTRTVTLRVRAGFLALSATAFGAPIFVTARSLESQSAHGTATLQVEACDVSTVSVRTPPASARDATQGSGLASALPGTVQSAIATPSRKMATLDGGMP